MGKPTSTWLTDEEQATWRAFVAAWPRLMSRLGEEMQQDAGISHSYYPILVNLSEAPGRTMRMSELAERLGSSRSRLSHAVARLEEAGWVGRRECASDRRGALAELTDAGMAVVEAAAPGHVASVRRHFFDQFTAEQQAAVRGICESLVAHLDEVEGRTDVGGRIWPC